MIDNKVEKSGIITIDMETMVDEANIIELDIKKWLFMELMLKEKEFRDYLKEHDWNTYQGKTVAVFCSSDAIVPTWAYMLIATCLNNISLNLVFGNKEKAFDFLLEKEINKINSEDFNDKRVVIKGCGNKNISPYFYMLLNQKLQNNVKSLMFGEPCSTVPIYKKK